MAGLLDIVSRGAKSPAFKLFLISFLILLLLVPLFRVHGLISEREGRARAVRSEVGNIWGPEQRLVGPFLVVPYSVRVEATQGDRRVEQVVERRALFTPERLEVTGAVEA